jgi:hypothetical protein
VVVGCRRCCCWRWSRYPSCAFSLYRQKPHSLFYGTVTYISTIITGFLALRIGFESYDEHQAPDLVVPISIRERALRRSLPAHHHDQITIHSPFRTEWLLASSNTRLLARSYGKRVRRRL